MDPLLRVEDLSTSFPGEEERVTVVEGMNLEISPGEVLALVGESGCGKSVTALSIMRLIPKPGRVDAGKVFLHGRNLRDLSVPGMRKVRGGDLGMIFQEPMTSLNPVRRVGEQVVEAIRLHEPISKDEARKRTRDLFAKVGIPDPEARLASFPHQLSGGLKQRVMIAMALAVHPALLIADEPTTALDVTIQAQILELLRELQSDLGMAILLITHDLGIVNELADRVAVMYAGQLVEEGTRMEVLGDPKHPYTRGLLRSMPALAEPGSHLEEIPGVVPSPGAWPKGCRFQNRCSQALEVCSQQDPQVWHRA